MKIFDCFTFFNELELLQLRFMTLYNIVDYFIIVEAGTTFTGKKKEFVFENNRTMFEKYLDKVIYLKIEALPFLDAWSNEYYSRDYMKNGLTSASDEDYVLLSDVDEIPNPVAILFGINNKMESFKCEQKLCYYYINCLFNNPWHGTVATKKKYITSMSMLRKTRGGISNVVKEGGWHYSFLGDVGKIKLKLEAYSETQTNNTKINNSEHILKCLETGEDLFYRDGDKRFVKNFVSIEKINHPELEQWLRIYPNFLKI